MFLSANFRSLNTSLSFASPSFIHKIWLYFWIRRDWSRRILNLMFLLFRFTKCSEVSSTNLRNDVYMQREKTSKFTGIVEVVYHFYLFSSICHRFWPPATFIDQSVAASLRFGAISSCKWKRRWRSIQLIQTNRVALLWKAWLKKTETELKKLKRFQLLSWTA